MMTENEKRALVEKALEARSFSYAPYSDFHVGAALLAKNGQVFTGCNIENASYTPTNCGERTAIFKAVSEGVRDFQAIAITGGPGMEPPVNIAAPCGVCRQVMMEFCDPETFIVLLGKGDKTWEEYTLAELLPLGFSGKNLEK
jgi:cytidine deaminase